MLFAPVLLLATSAAASSAFKRADNSSFPIDSIPASCDTQCSVYKNIFNTCPGNPSDAACGAVCNGTTLTDLQVCINCTQIEGLAAGTVTQYQLDILNGAQQALAQECVDEGFPATFTGTVATQTTVTYPSGVDQATFASNSTSTSAPAATTTSSANGTATSSAAATATDKKSGAGALSVSGGAAVFAAAVALVL